MKKITATFALSFLLACNSTAKTEQPVENDPLKNIIMVVADGMGPAYVSAYRYFADDPATKQIEQTIFDRHLIGNATTYPASVSGYVTDSAAAATALASGIKTYNGAIGVDVNKQKVTSVLQKAKQLGKKTGVVVTSQVNHATPASYISHNEYRRNYNAIADSYVDNGINTDVLLGGGRHYFIRDDRNLVKEYQAANVHYIDQYSQLTDLPKNTPVLGLFADKGLPEALDDSNGLRLSMMTEAAIKQLENPNGFFMLIEASQVDWAGHGNDVSSAMAEMRDLAHTLVMLEQYVKNNPDTLVIVTADHSTGGLTIAANGVYEWRPELLRKMTESPLSIAKHFVSHTISEQTLSSKLAGIEISKEEAQAIKEAKQTSVSALKQFLALEKDKKMNMKKPNVAMAIHKALKQLIDKKTNTGWTGGGHTAVDVPVFAFGAQKDTFRGTIDNTDIAKKIFALLK